jgi:TatD DNase family protein
LISDCDRHGIATLAVTTTPKAWSRNYQLAAHSKHVRVALGLHPQLVSERAAEIIEFERLLPETRYVGEVGLDAGPAFFKSLSEQKEVFQRILQLCAANGDKILTVHSVRAVGQVLDMIEAHLPPGRGRVVLHWFTGTRAQARRAAELGCFFSINSRMLVKPSHRELVKQLPEDRLLTETDGPFVKMDDRPVVPHDVVATVSDLGYLLGTPSADLARRLLDNLRTLVSE